jgi:hypothetical protein
MKSIIVSLIILFFLVSISSCRKDSFITSPNALLNTSVDTVRFDTVFTTTGSVTRSFKIFNKNNQKLRLNNVKLMGGFSSAFKMNVDGTPGTSFSSIEIEPNDSLYVFISVSINPSVANLPFMIQDSVLINYNGNNRFVQLEAFGQNANFLRSRRITTDTTWNNNLPYVILDSILVDNNVTLTINKGCRIYCHADAAIIINGTLKVNGEKNDSTRVRFQGDRLDPAYKDFPGSWPGIIFTPGSKDNILNFAIIKNAYRGIITQLPSTNANFKITLNECIFDNIYDAGILSINSSISAKNCLITNCGYNVFLTAGGNYSFNYCTVASYGTYNLPHKNAALTLSNVSGNTTLQLNAIFKNSIIYGDGGNVDDEILIDIQGNPTIVFDNILYKGKKDVRATGNVFKNFNPQFDSINISKPYFNFHLKSTSPAINNGRDSTNALFDLDGKTRGQINGLPDLGCYEF